MQPTQRKFIAVGLLANAAILGVVSCFLSSLVTVEVAANKYKVATGVWYTDRTQGNLGGQAGAVDYSGTETCNDRFPLVAQSACSKARKAKCQTQKAFSVTAVVFNVAAAFVIQFEVKPAVLRLSTAAFASLGYLIIWAIAAGLVHADRDDSASCGLAAPGRDVGYGAAFALYIMAWLFSSAATVMCCLDSSNGVTPRSVVTRVQRL